MRKVSIVMPALQHSMRTAINTIASAVHIKLFGLVFVPGIGAIAERLRRSMEEDDYA